MRPRSASRFAPLIATAITLAACGDSEVIDSTDPVCGNGIEEAPEECDDGNTVGGDGCSASCRDESINALCGNGNLDSGEACDDRNFTDDDGCTSCQVDSGYTCTGSPSVCSNSLCGNGAIDGDEGCDDGNFVGDDGCSACVVDENWTCTGAPSVCTEDEPPPAQGTCTNPTAITLTANASGVLTGTATGTTVLGEESGVAEFTCGSFTGGDGPDKIFSFTIAAASAVRIFLPEPDFDPVLRVTSTVCDVTTQVAANPGAGCSDTTGDEVITYNSLPAGTYFLVVDGYSDDDVGDFEVEFTVTPNPVCGNGNVEPGEDCDGGSATVMGCSATCVASPGYVCSGSPSVCAETCGDGILDANEACDDDDLDNGDGCSDNCKVEDGFMCTGTPSVCEVAACNDGTFDITEEECDDQNQTAGDGCSLTCALEFDLLEVENNNVAPQALPLTFSGSDAHVVVKGALAPASDVDLFEFTLSSPASIKLETYNAIDGNDANYNGTGDFDYFDCVPTTMDTQVAVFAEGADYTGSGYAYYNDDGGANNCSYITGTLQPGTYVIRVNAYLGRLTPLYMLDVRVTSMVAMPGLSVNEVFANPGTMGDSNCDGAFSSSNDEFIELVNRGTATIDLTGVTVSDDVRVRHTFTATATPGSMMLAPGKSVVIWGGGVPACAGVTNWFTASTGSLGLNNDSPETVTVRTGTTIVARGNLAVATQGVSLNRSPDITGTVFANHDTVTGAGTRKFSPGLKVDGTAF